MGRIAKTFDLESFLSSVDGGRSQLQYEADQTIFAQGDPCDAVFYIRAGQCKMTVVSEHGKEAIVAIHGDGDFFGEACLTGHQLRLAGDRVKQRAMSCELAIPPCKASFAANHASPNFSCRTCSNDKRGSKRIWSISFLIRAKRDWPASCC